VNLKTKIGLCAGNAFGQRQFQCPYGVTVDRRSGNILVADADTNRVFEFSGPTGRFIRYAVTSSADGCRRPCGLAAGPDCGTLVVTEGADPDDGCASVRAYRLYDAVNVEQVWTLGTESVI